MHTVPKIKKPYMLQSSISRIFSQFGLLARTLGYIAYLAHIRVYRILIMCTLGYVFMLIKDPTGLSADKKSAVCGDSNCYAVSGFLK